MKAIEALAQDARRLSERENLLLQKIIESIRSIVLDEGSLASRENRLETVDRYLKVKLRSSEKGVSTKGVDQLRFVRNSVMHGKQVPDAVLDKAISVFWSLLNEAAGGWNTAHLNHLLSYSLGLKELFNGAPDVSPREIISHYKTLFKRLPLQERRRLFVQQILPTIYNTDEFRLALRSKAEGLDV
jgi:hypothetical protein